MQKKLLTVAVASALAAPGLALAQSSVEVYGTVNMSFGLVTYSKDTSTLVSGVSKWDVANHASNYGLRGRESLGGGLTGWFQIEQNAPLERSNNVAITPASRNSAVGIQGSWGNFFMGQWTTPWADLDSLWSVGTVGGWGPVTSVIGRRETTGTAPNTNCVNGHWSGGATPKGLPTDVALTPCDAVAGGGGVGHAFWRRISNSVFYQSPTFLGGWQFKLGLQTNEGKSTSVAAATTVARAVTSRNPYLWSTSLQWAGMGGQARVGVSYDRHHDFTTVGRNDIGYALKGGWNFGVADIGVALERMTYKPSLAPVDCNTSQWGLAIAIPTGTGAIRASYARASDAGATCGAPANPFGSTASSATSKNGANEFNIGYEHRFSKRTQVGFGYAAINNDAGGAWAWTGLPPSGNGFSNTPAAGADVSTWFINITHRF